MRYQTVEERLNAEQTIYSMIDQLSETLQEPPEMVFIPAVCVNESGLYEYSEKSLAMLKGGCFVQWNHESQIEILRDVLPPQLLELLPNAIRRLSLLDYSDLTPKGTRVCIWGWDDASSLLGGFPVDQWPFFRELNRLVTSLARRAKAPASESDDKAD